jgi:hypothetical protein
MVVRPGYSRQGYRKTNESSAMLRVCYKTISPTKNRHQEKLNASNIVSEIKDYKKN